MAITVDWPNKVVLSTASIPDIVAFKDDLRLLEESEVGVLYPPILTYKKVDLGGGGFFHAVDFINGYQLKFPNPGNFSIIGNIGATVVPVAGVFVDRTKASAFATVAGGGGGATSSPPLYVEGIEYQRPQGVVVTDGTNSSLVFKVSFVEEPPADFGGALILFVSGPVKHQTRKVSAFNTTSDFVTVTQGFTQTPAPGDAFVLITF